MKEFKIGDIVQLKSGSPKMTIESFDEDGRLYCTWFVNDKQEYSYFIQDIIIKSNI